MSPETPPIIQKKLKDHEKNPHNTLTFCSGEIGRVDGLRYCLEVPLPSRTAQVGNLVILHFILFLNGNQSIYLSYLYVLLDKICYCFVVQPHSSHNEFVEWAYQFTKKLDVFLTIDTQQCAKSLTYTFFTFLAYKWITRAYLNYGMNRT